jgi:zinc protease
MHPSNSSPTRLAGLIVTAGLWAVLFVAAGSGMGAAVRPPKLDYTMATLPNGLQVVFLEDHSTPIVHTEIWYHVGSKNEKPGRTGFAHLFEHMMFKGSKNVEPEGHPSYISSVGGQSNAYTNEDSTVFWETTPAQYLPLVLWLEADRMASLRIEDSVFKTEREVVKEERRMRVENQPYGRLNEIIYDQAFTVHPYKHPTIGSMTDLESASIEDVRDFFRTYYVPNNATLVLVGDFETKDAQELVTKYLGRVPKSSKPVPRDIPKEPPQTKERRVSLTESWPLPAVVVAYHITYDGSPDSYPLHIASKVLSDGQSARIYRDLVYTKQIALAAFGGGNIIEDPNLFFAVAIVQPGKTPQECIDALIAEFDRLKTEPVSANELQQAKNQWTRDYIIGRESNKDKAEALAHAVVIHNDIKTADGEFDIFMNITAADVQRVAKTYFTPENRLVMTIMPKGTATGGDR